MSGKHVKIFSNVHDWIAFRKNNFTGKLGFIPTMGALHDGHASLMARSVFENEKTLVSIFVNPTQFDDKKDLINYPKTLDLDLEILEENKVDYLLLPTPEQIYPDHFNYSVDESELSKLFCGKFRNGHFKGMLTVVLKLLLLAKSQRAYFGLKDFQQFTLIKEMCESFFIDTEIIGCEIVREENGLAMSSRNQRLSAAEKNRASKFFEILKTSDTAELANDQLKKLEFQVDYVEDYKNRRLGAIRIGETRLIDNVELKELKGHGGLTQVF
jgi:pantoate--beta-alanine ligase